jgi:hypothetical protein
MTMTLVALTDDGALEYVQRGEETGGVVAFVVMGERPSASARERQTRLSPIQPESGSPHRHKAPRRYRADFKYSLTISMSL